MEKAYCYEAAACFDDALSTLERIRLYQLSGADRQAVLLAKARCCYALGDWAPALSHLEESGQASLYPAWYAVLLSYDGQYEEAEAVALRCCSLAGAGQSANMAENLDSVPAAAGSALPRRARPRGGLDARQCRFRRPYPLAMHGRLLDYRPSRRRPAA